MTDGQLLSPIRIFEKAKKLLDFEETFRFPFGAMRTVTESAGGRVAVDFFDIIGRIGVLSRGQTFLVRF